MAVERDLDRCIETADRSLCGCQGRPNPPAVLCVSLQRTPVYESVLKASNRYDPGAPWLRDALKNPSIG